jgi:E3 ubiquitin-protein ligase RFWD2
MLERDIGRVKQRLERGDSSNEPVIALQTALNEGEPEVPVIQEEFLHSAKRALIENDDDDDNDDDGGNSRRAEPTTMLHLQEQVNTAASDAKAILQEHFVDLQACYFDESADDPLDSFGEKIAKLTKLTRIRQVSALKLGDIAGSSNIISSIEFDRDSQIFATAGVSKKIRFYEFRDAMNSYLDLHCPVREISCKSKVSCISWNPYVQQQIASADYEGLITVYDANTSTVVCHLEEHEKRSWSVDFSSTDPTRLASGSDDCYVKLWSLKSKKSICTIDGKANICSVRFHPDYGHLLAFGSAGDDLCVVII